MRPLDPATLAAVDAPLNAFADIAPDARFGSGALAGVTVGVKSNIAVAGLPHTGGMGWRRGMIADTDGVVVARLRGAGAAILGTLNMHEGALGATTDNAFYGRTHNPHRPGYTPGGSSGGSGAAVAAGLCDVALGTDTLGSVRIPAGYCGVYGLKPTPGRVSTVGLLFLEPAFDTIGPIARDLDVLARAFAVIADVASPRAMPTRAVVLDDRYGVTCEPAVRAGHERALTALGLPVATLALADDATAIRMAGLVEAGRYLANEIGAERWDDPSAVSAGLRFLLDLTTTLPRAPGLLGRTRDAVRGAIGDDGVLVLPTTPQVAFAHRDDPGGAPPSQADYTCLANIAGLPALAIPAGRDVSGLPVSVQLVGPPGSDEALIALARTLESALGGATLPPGLPEGE